MKSGKATDKNKKRLDYEKPRIKEEVAFEQKAFACGGYKHGKCTGGTFSMTS